tara:strand:+ start:224455 stop:227235 length:2781 start_codon:yes stop_codon:yes gene_type:complete
MDRYQVTTGPLRLPTLPLPIGSKRAIVKFRLPPRSELILAAFFAILIGMCMTGSAKGESAWPQEDLDFFEAKIRPLLIEHCYDCHSRQAGESAGNLLVDSSDGLARGGDHGPALTARHPESSLIIKAIEYDNNHLQMPPDGKLDDESIDALRQWIQRGAPDPRTDSSDPESILASSQTQSPLDRDPSSHWAFVVPTIVPGPAVHQSRLRDVVDGFVTVGAKANALQLNPAADRETLIRRLYFDLAGTPPSPDVIERFVHSDHPAAYERLVDSLLAAPEFAERFGRHWLDVARYADTLGYTTAGKPRTIDGSDRYRDWVIDSFASDLPYDQMIRLQLAADRIVTDNRDGHFDAMGFLTIGRRFLNRYDTIDDRIDVISRGLIGLTVSCARCHDHKFDPIPTKDYYSLFSILSNSEQPEKSASPLMMVDRPKIQKHHVLVRGQASIRGEEAPRQYLTAFRQPSEDTFRDGSGRRELADRIASSDNPLTARVMVNRIWSHLIGRPLVHSPSDFGFRTPPPNIPEVLDDLAADFASHWSIKRIVRRIVLTETYRQDSRTTEEAKQKDPDNAWLCRGNRRRRDFESLRDSFLHSADWIDRTIGGPSTEITLDTLTPRRTIYAKIDRQNLPPIFRTFDFASPDAHSAGRYYTTVPQQALYLINSKQMIELAQRVVARVKSQAANQATSRDVDVHDQVDALFACVLQRRPSVDERRWASEFLAHPTTPLPESIETRRLWSYGTATTDADLRVKEFSEFEFFRRDQWQAAASFPADGPLGYASLGKESGHPGSGQGGAVVRRLTSPVSGHVKITGTMGHRAQQGDGVRMRIWAGSNSVFDQTLKGRRRPFGPSAAKIKEGEHIDFVASGGPTSNHDTFVWRMRVQITDDSGNIIETESMRDFSGPLPLKSKQSLERLAQLAQVLLISNEFAFVD